MFLFGTRYPGAHWAAALSGALGGVDFWRLVHRLGGTLLIVTAGYHLMYSLLHEEGRRDFRLMWPILADFKHLGQNLLFFAGRSSRPPRFGRFTYFEKFDYWAVFWGCVIMIGTGLALWFNDVVLLVIPGVSQQVFDAFKEAHAHEAVLAVLAIVIWHMYNIHLRPGRFPWSWLWVHGRVSREEIEREHPRSGRLPAIALPAASRGCCYEPARGVHLEAGHSVHVEAFRDRVRTGCRPQVMGQGENWLERFERGSPSHGHHAWKRFSRH
jgi:cytochrome b subunit of formate dehydrogenase